MPPRLERTVAVFLKLIFVKLARSTQPPSTRAATTLMSGSIRINPSAPPRAPVAAMILGGGHGFANG